MKKPVFLCLIEQVRPVFDSNAVPRLTSTYYSLISIVFDWLYWCDIEMIKINKNE